MIVINKKHGIIIKILFISGRNSVIKNKHSCLLSLENILFCRVLNIFKIKNLWMKKIKTHFDYIKILNLYFNYTIYKLKVFKSLIRIAVRLVNEFSFKNK